mmetsp:Transcript_6146/g.8971  ORF Transcript_6146/g.8971 Transcript_6146/m.8971 type:complete len:134 (+) Transcript_6146:167-568(+)
MKVMFNTLLSVALALALALSICMPADAKDVKQLDRGLKRHKQKHKNKKIKEQGQEHVNVEKTVSASASTSLLFGEVEGEGTNTNTNVESREHLFGEDAQVVQSVPVPAPVLFLFGAVKDTDKLGKATAKTCEF